MKTSIPNSDAVVGPIGECDVCGEAAVFQAGEIANGISLVRLLCEECAAKHLLPQQQNELDID